MMGCLWHTTCLPLIISIDDNGEECMHVDRAHALDTGEKRHHALLVAMVRGANFSVSKKIGLATTSSTETEIASNGESFLKCAWFHYFRLAQVNDAKEDLLC